MTMFLTPSRRIASEEIQPDEASSAAAGRERRWRMMMLLQPGFASYTSSNSKPRMITGVGAVCPAIVLLP